MEAKHYKAIGVWSDGAIWTCVYESKREAKEAAAKSGGGVR